MKTLAALHDSVQATLSSSLCAGRKELVENISIDASNEFVILSPALKEVLHAGPQSLR